MSERKRPPSVKTQKPVKSKKKYRPTFNDFLTNNFRIVALAVLFLIVGALVWIVATPEKPAAAPTEAAAEPAAAGVQTPAAAPTEAPAKPAARQYDSEPEMAIDPAKNYTAVVNMAKGGEFTIQLYADKAPRTVNSFVFLAREGYFDGVTFHRVLDNFMAQGGDPTGSGMGGPGYKFPNEDSDLTFDRPGVVAMANAGRDTNGSQFFITFVPRPDLNGGYTIFGQVTAGMDVVNALTRRDPNQNPSFSGDVIESVTIQEE